MQYSFDKLTAAENQFGWLTYLPIHKADNTLIGSCGYKGRPNKNGEGEIGETPMVFAWMPAIAIYFNDPDEHQLEFIAILEGKSRPELGVISYEKWKQLELEQ